MNKHIGTSLNSFLEEEDLLTDSQLVAIKRLIALQIQKTMLDNKLTKISLAKKIRTSRTALDHWLNPANLSHFAN